MEDNNDIICRYESAVGPHCDMTWCADAVAEIRRLRDKCESDRHRLIFEAEVAQIEKPLRDRISSLEAVLLDVARHLRATGDMTMMGRIDGVLGTVMGQPNVVFRGGAQEPDESAAGNTTPAKQG